MTNPPHTPIRTNLPALRRRGRAMRGFTVLLAALVSSIVLALGTSIFLIAKKQITLSALGRDSQFAFYAADSGAECALYWDVKKNAFDVTPPAEVPRCAGQNLGETVSSGSRSAPPYTISFQINLFANVDGILGTIDDSGYCVQVAVNKNTSAPFTSIRADGYSTSCATIATSPRSLQRSVELQY
jgi:hypothetical protein